MGFGSSQAALIDGQITQSEPNKAQPSGRMKVEDTGRDGYVEVQ
jgi:hypothetical protein